MALSRLRQPVISRAPSLLRARFLSFSSAHPSLYRSWRLNSGADIAETLLSRPTSFSVVNGVHDNSSKLKFQSGVRCYSSSELHDHTVLQMPALSPTMNQGNIAKWRKKEGDKIEVGDVICEIETDKATLEFECLEEGFLARILVPEGSKDVPVGQPIAITVEDPNDIPNVPATVSGSAATDKSSSKEAVTHENSKEESSSVNISTSELPPHIVLEMPALSPTMNQGNIAKWRKKEGDKIEVGDVICEIETDKATLEFESLEEGFLAKILAPEGSKEVAVGQPIAITVEDPNDLEAIKTSVSGDLSVKDEKPVQRSTPKDIENQKSSFNRISPAAKLLIKEHGLDASSIVATGPRGTLLKGDVIAAIKSGKGFSKLSESKENSSSSSPVLPHTSSSASVGSKSIVQQLDAYEDLPNSQIRKVIATRLLESKQSIPHLYLSTDVILDPLLSFRKELKARYDVKVSVNDIVIKAVAIALRNVPEANAYWDSGKGEMILCDSVDISIAVATEKGLMTPIVRNADQKSISSISLEVKELAEKARTGKLKPNEFQGGTFSISNLGMFPVDRFCAIINPPQAGILAVGRGNQVVEPVVGDDGIAKLAVVTKLNLTLSADHRVFDGKVGGTFVAALQSNFSDIRRLLL
ncbi:hypothetical protein Pfo_027225 [Paulownia fortunei]|nr:hypothetical protein Pfo_027225 [Paulownia fortunei]